MGRMVPDVTKQVVGAAQRLDKRFEDLVRDMVIISTAMKSLKQLSQDIKGIDSRLSKIKRRPVSYKTQLMLR
jgi:hypothetical protein